MISSTKGYAFCFFSVNRDAALAEPGDLVLSTGYKLWINTWQTSALNANTAGEGDNVISLSKNGIAHIPNVALKYKRFLMAFGYVTTGDYKYARYTDRDSGGIDTFDTTASRDEVNLDFGFYVHRSILLTAGYKGVFQKFRTSVNGGTPGEGKTNYNGMTLGVHGSAAIGKGFSIYGNGAGGFMSVNYDPDPGYNDFGLYESSEIGLAWKAPQAPISVSFGYRYQVIDTFLNESNPNYSSTLTQQRGVDVTRGYVLGFNWLFGA